MPTAEPLSITKRSERLNVADRLAEIARTMPEAIAIVSPRRASPTSHQLQQGRSGTAYSTATFAELDASATRIARGFTAWGVPPGTRLALLVRPGIEFVALVFGLLRAGIVIVLVDPGLGRRNLIRCLADAKPEGFGAIGLAHAVRTVLRHRFPIAKWNVTVGRRWFWGGITFDQLNAKGDHSSATLPATTAPSPAAIIFTSGSTGTPKGVLYTQRMFDTQVTEIQTGYGIQPGGLDLACFPLFALFNSAMGVTTVFPEMDFSCPASADPAKLLAAANDWRVTQAFASPAVWERLGPHCAKSGSRIESLRQVFSCGAPVRASVLRSTLDFVAPGAQMHTPYGATECLPVTSIEAIEVLNETAIQTDSGAGVCVGRKFDSIDWRIIRITDEPIPTIDRSEDVAPGEIGELTVRGPLVSPAYVTRTEANAIAKIDVAQSAIQNPQSEITNWHRTGDVGYIDVQNRFWYCGRKSHRVETTAGPLYTECIEPIFNTHSAIRRCALVGVGPVGRQIPVLIVEPEAGNHTDSLAHEITNFANSHGATRAVERILFYRQLPVDIRHNAKINREWLAAWAAKQLSAAVPEPPVSSP
ncbi:MAG TPA: fatty acid CoA ligase family protein [Lacipirellulaceae bacterium]|nr:fatty acid CoA ligase family protein [Lacipirellulaceae bacterium]